jgi:hypothetical protein
MRRAIMPGAFAVEPLSSPIAVALVALLVAPCAATLSLMLTALTAQLAFAAIAVRVIRGHALPIRYLALEPLRALILQWCWIRAASSRSVVWRGNPFVLGRDSVLHRKHHGRRWFARTSQNHHFNAAGVDHNGLRKQGAYS